MTELSDGAPAGGRTMTDDNLQALFFLHKKAYETRLAAKKAADADFKNACKLAKSELGDTAVADIKTAIQLETEDGEAKLKAKIDAQLRVARWMAVPLGSQSDLFGQPDRTPLAERARKEGYAAGLEGKNGVSPYQPGSEADQEWLAGWHDGQKEMVAVQKKRDSDEFDAKAPLLKGAAAKKGATKPAKAAGKGGRKGKATASAAEPHPDGVAAHKEAAAAKTADDLGEADPVIDRSFNERLGTKAPSYQVQ